MVALHTLLFASRPNGCQTFIFAKSFGSAAIRSTNKVRPATSEERASIRLHYPGLVCGGTTLVRISFCFPLSFERTEGTVASLFGSIVLLGQDLTDINKVQAGDLYRFSVTSLECEYPGPLRAQASISIHKINCICQHPSLFPSELRRASGALDSRQSYSQFLSPPPKFLCFAGVRYMMVKKHAFEWSDNVLGRLFLYCYDWLFGRGRGAICGVTESSTKCRSGL